MRNRLFTSLGIALLLSCGRSDNQFEKRVSSHIEDSCKSSNNCTININDITDFNWQKMYIFKEGATLEEVNQALGFNYPYFTDIASRIIFVNDHKITYHEDIFPDVEGIEDRQVIFTMPDTVNYRTYTSKEAVFKVRKVSLVKGAYYYELIK